MTAKQKNKRNVKIANTVIYSVGAAMFVASILSSSEGQQRASTVKPSRAKSVTDIINDRRNVEVSSLTRMHKEGKMDADQFKNFSTILNARYDRKIAEAIRDA